MTTTIKNTKPSAIPPNIEAGFTSMLITHGSDVDSDLVSRAVWYKISGSAKSTAILTTFLYEGVNNLILSGLSPNTSYDIALSWVDGLVGSDTVLIDEQYKGVSTVLIPTESLNNTTLTPAVIESIVTNPESAVVSLNLVLSGSTPLIEIELESISDLGNWVQVYSGPFSGRLQIFAEPGSYNMRYRSKVEFSNGSTNVTSYTTFGSQVDVVTTDIEFLDGVIEGFDSSIALLEEDYLSVVISTLANLNDIGLGDVDTETSKSTVRVIEGRTTSSEGSITELNFVDITSTSALVQSYLSLQGAVNDPSTGLVAAQGSITELNFVDITSTSALVQSYLSLQGAVNDPSTGLAVATAEITQLNTINVSSTSALASSYALLRSTLMEGDLTTPKYIAEVLEGNRTWVGRCSVPGNDTESACTIAGGTWTPGIAFADSFKLVTVTGTGGTVTVGEIFQAQTDLEDEVVGKAVIGVDVNGVFTGLSIVGGTSFSEIVFRGNTIQFQNTAGTPYLSYNSGNNIWEFTGTVKVGGTSLNSTNTLNVNTTSSDVGLGSVDNDSTSTIRSVGAAITGTVGGWTISSESIYSGVEQLSDAYSTSGITFDKDGAIRAVNFRVDTTGEAFFKAGKIADWTIEGDSIVSGTRQVSGFTTGGITLQGGSVGGLFAKQFYIDNAGSAFFKGSLTASTGTFVNGANTMLLNTSGFLIWYGPNASSGSPTATNATWFLNNDGNYKRNISRTKATRSSWSNNFTLSPSSHFVIDPTVEFNLNLNFTLYDVSFLDASANHSGTLTITVKFYWGGTLLNTQVRELIYSGITIDGGAEPDESETTATFNGVFDYDLTGATLYSSFSYYTVVTITDSSTLTANATSKTLNAKFTTLGVS